MSFNKLRNNILAGAFAAAAVAGSGANAAPVTITFDDLVFENSTVIGNTYSDSGFTFTTTQGITAIGSSSPAYLGTPSVAVSQLSDSLTITNSSGFNFTPVSATFGELQDLGSVTIPFSNGSASDSFLTDGILGPDTFSFTSAFNNSSSLIFDRTSPGWSLDSITLDVVPPVNETATVDFSDVPTDGVFTDLGSSYNKDGFQFDVVGGSILSLGADSGLLTDPAIFINPNTATATVSALDNGIIRPLSILADGLGTDVDIFFSGTDSDGNLITEILTADQALDMDELFFTNEGWDANFQEISWTSDNLAQISQINFETGPVNPIPLPSAVWMFGAGALGLFRIALDRTRAVA